MKGDNCGEDYGNPKGWRADKANEREHPNNGQTQLNLYQTVAIVGTEQCSREMEPRRIISKQ